MLYSSIFFDDGAGLKFEFGLVSLTPLLTIGALGAMRCWIVIPTMLLSVSLAGKGGVFYLVPKSLLRI